MACSPVDGRDAGHCVIVTDALRQEPVPDLPGEHSRVLSLVFSNLVHNFGCCHFGLGAADHSGLDAAGLVVPAPGRPAGSARSGWWQGQGAAGAGAAEPLSCLRQWHGGKRPRVSEPASRVHLARAGTQWRMRGGTPGALPPWRWPYQRLHAQQLESMPLGVEARPLIWEEWGGGGTVLGGLQTFPTEHRDPTGTRTNLLPPQADFSLLRDPFLPSTLFLQPSLPKGRAVLPLLKTGIRLSSNPPFQREGLSFRF